MPRGGKRHNSGRKPLFEDAQLAWVADTVRAEFKCQQIAWHDTYVLRKDSKNEYVSRFHREIRASSVPERRAALLNPDAEMGETFNPNTALGEKLGDIDAMLFGDEITKAPPEVERLVHIPPLPPAMKRPIWHAVAEVATLKFGKRFTASRIQLIMRRWAKLERSFS